MLIPMLPWPLIPANYRQECISLGLRLHDAMWVHGSFYQRNVLQKPGPLSASPSERRTNVEKRKGYGESWSFRLIDFGRSEYVGDLGDQVIGALDAEHQKLKSWHAELRELG
jgi:hypothetical protein